jgi:integrase
MFGSLSAAELHARSKVNSLSMGEAAVIQLSGEERLAYLRAKQALAEFGLAVDSAATEFRDARRILGGLSLLEAARYYAAHHLQKPSTKTVSEIFEELIEGKRSEGLSERYVEDLESRVGKFAGDFKCPLASVTGPEIREWLQKMPVANRTKNNFRLAIQTLISFAKAQKYLPKEWGELEAVPTWKTNHDSIGIFTPHQMVVLLSVADQRMIPFLAIGAFAGLRTAEIERLDWSKVSLATGYITIDASIAKTNARRVVPIAANLHQWLEPLAKSEGPVMEIANVANAIQRLVNATRPTDPKNPDKIFPPEVPWTHNGCRHSFCSYRLAEVQNAAQVAYEAGNSPQIIFKHYRSLVTPEQAKAWFSIVPERAANVTPMPAVAEK